MENIQVKSLAGDYEILFKKFQIMPEDFIITDTNLVKVLGAPLEDHERKLVFEPGEVSKNIDSVLRIVNRLQALNFSKTQGIIALGGGVVGDMTGFAAGIFKRGIPYVQVPTTLLAMVDSSVGGKTGVNHRGQKNFLGLIHPPERVIIDTDFLKVLPEEEMANGYGEIIKYALLDLEFFQALQKNPAMETVIAHCLRIKKRYVEADEFDEGERMHLNLGHSYGHIIESRYGVRHGIAVLYGIEIIIKKYGDEELLENFYRLVRHFDIALERTFDPAELEAFLFEDKKVRDGHLNLVVPKGIGDIEILSVREMRSDG